MPALFLLVSALVTNYVRHRNQKSTICSTCRTRVGPRLFLAAWTALTAWMLPHYMNPSKFSK
jgi:hypothetical protein